MWRPAARRFKEARSTREKLKNRNSRRGAGTRHGALAHGLTGARFGCLILLGLAGLALASSGVLAEPCVNNAQVLGTERTIVVEPWTLPRVGTLQYPQTLPLGDHEVVLTFDDGPAPETTGKVLDALAAECVKANFFVMGAHAAQEPALVRREAREGHTVGTHTQTHPDLTKLPSPDAEAEIADAIAAANTALDGEAGVAPFFRAPYLMTNPVIDGYLRAQKLMLWSIDVDSQDWRNDSAANVLTRIFDGLNRVGKGIVLMHDVQPCTAEALPVLLKELHHSGYQVVHVVPAQLTAGALPAQ
jgi:peptidoglycan/xylan/chitin deacetylase (PgdA/CDA1 family)